MICLLLPSTRGMLQIQFPARIVKPFIPMSSLRPSTIKFSTLQDLAANHKGLAKVILKKAKTQIFKDGSPMVYSGAVDRIIGRPPPKTGDVVLVADGSEKPIGWGLYNSTSMFCIRLMQLEEEAMRDASCALDMDKLLKRRLDDAIKLRRSLGLPSANTNAYRLVNSEGDRLSGLIVDVFGDIAVVASSAAWVEKYRPEIESYLGRISAISHINWRPSIDILKEEGLDVCNLKNIKACSHVDKVKVIENGIFYSVSLEGQKTGFYADQRENRWLIGSIAKSRRVLDVCCYSGGFALNAATGGADDVIGIDSSVSALELARENVQLNNFDGGRISFLKEDAVEFMKRAASKNEMWDLVILDPPKLAPRRKILQNASGMYRSLNSLAMQITKRGGLLMTCSCSGAMTQSGLFLPTLQFFTHPFPIAISRDLSRHRLTTPPADDAASRRLTPPQAAASRRLVFTVAAANQGGPQSASNRGAAKMVNRKITVLRHAGAACDHPIDPSYPEGAYLTNYLLRVL